MLHCGCVLKTLTKAEIMRGTQFQTHTGFVIGFMTGATIGSVIIVIAINQSWGWVFQFCEVGVFTHLLPAISAMGARVKCELFVYVKHTVYGPLDTFPLPSIYLLFFDCALKAN